MPIVADSYRYVVGVDTHAEQHTFVIIETSRTPVDSGRFATHRAGLRRAATWIARRTGGDLDGVLVVVECTGSYGRGIAEVLAETGYDVVEAPTVRRHAGKAKSDPIDAAEAAAGVLHLPCERLRRRRAGQAGQAATVLLAAREAITGERTSAVNRVTALVRGWDLGIDARKRLTTTQVRTIAAWRERDEPLPAKLARAESTRLARRIADLDEQDRVNYSQLAGLVRQYAPDLLTRPGIGPVSAARLLAAWSQHGRIHSADAFARLAGTCPIPASSGKHQQMRLNRGGDRKLNAALHTIAANRMRYDPTTRDYVARRRAEGKTDRAIRRCLKRYITREAFRCLNAHDHAPTLDKA